MEKSANQLWRESGTSLSFADWIQREKEKGYFINNKKVQDTLESLKESLGIGENKNAQQDTNASINTFGLSKIALGLTIVIIAGAIGYKIYQKRKQ